ncbi:transcriptional regulator [Sphingomonas jejuensis]|uniref:Transcriptional regulator n=1 Tax=Sphingomonas jejuensis TaxID=904715 RepID=A0ABX0XPC1_9SPHN|nr:FMN-binding negative transcriptional regulator [Sphingomonas jejuensis]NJC34702.1 transcriptional regulator [Sphingomonas jejuensis]
MHPDPAFRVEDRAWVRRFVADHPFGTLFVQTDAGPRVVHLPVTPAGDDAVRFHLSARNDVADRLDGATALFVASGPHHYVSPDWYRLGPGQVPTWNYVAAELEGTVHPLGRAALAEQVDLLVAQSERALAPKPAWTRAGMKPGTFDAMLNDIRGFELRITAWRATCKMNQNKSDAARLAAADGVAAAGDPATAAWMRNPA